MPTFPPDDHTHTEWSWDARSGSMEGSCARAVELGLPSIAFTEHVDFTRWLLAPEVATEAAALAEAAGFHPRRHPHDFWLRHPPFRWTTA